LRLLPRRDWSDQEETPKTHGHRRIIRGLIASAATSAVAMSAFYGYFDGRFGFGLIPFEMLVVLAG
jgi:hypothetical protein